MSKHPETGIYRIYLLTVWKREGDAECIRFVMEDPRSGMRRGFTSVGDLVDGLLAMSGLLTSYVERQESRTTEFDVDTSAAFPDC